MTFPNAAIIWRTGAAFIASGVIAGAFGTHALKRQFTPDQLHAWETASSYAIFNGAALLAISLHPRFAAHRWAAPAIGFGTLGFSGSIFTMALNRDGSKFLGPITPIGGAIMIAGYIALAF